MLDFEQATRPFKFFQLVVSGMPSLNLHNNKRTENTEWTDCKEALSPVLWSCGFNFTGIRSIDLQPASHLSTQLVAQH